MLRLWSLAKALIGRLLRLPREAAVALGAEGLGRPARPDRLWKAILLVAPPGLAAWWAMTQITFVMSPSIPNPHSRWTSAGSFTV